MKLNTIKGGTVAFPDKIETAAEIRACYDEIVRLLPRDDGVARDADWLKTKLTTAHAIFTRDRSYARDGVCQALDALIEFARENADLSFSEEPVLLLPLEELLRALKKLDLGFGSPLLERGPRGAGARPLSLIEREFRFVVAYITELKATESDLEAACKFVSKELHKRGFKRQRLRPGSYMEDITPSTIKNWHRDLSDNWHRINAERKMTFDQYLFHLCGYCAHAIVNGGAHPSVADAFLHALQPYFGHLAVE
jgi:hypothetical protein